MDLAASYVSMYIMPTDIKVGIASMKMGIFSNKKEHKVRGAHRMTFMIITDATKDPISIRLPKWIRFPLLALFCCVVLASSLIFSYVVDMESDLNTALVDWDLQAQADDDEKEMYLNEIAQLENELAMTREELFDELVESQLLTEELMTKLEAMEEYTDAMAKFKQEIDINLSTEEEVEVEEEEEKDDQTNSQLDMITDGTFNARLMRSPDIFADVLSTSSMEAMTIGGTGQGMGGGLVNPSVSSETVDFQFEIAKLNDYLNMAILEVDSEQDTFAETSVALAEIIPYVEAYPSVLPIDGAKVTSPFGYRRNPFGGYSKEFHKGIDLKAYYEPVKATGGGVVVEARYLSGYGYTVVIDHGYGLMTKYAHNRKLYVKVGDTVERGDIICKSGNSGRSTGPHLHYEVILDGEVTDPLDYIYEEKINENE